MENLASSRRVRAWRGWLVPGSRKTAAGDVSNQVSAPRSRTGSSTPPLWLVRRRRQQGSSETDSRWRRMTQPGPPGARRRRLAVQQNTTPSHGRCERHTDMAHPPRCCAGVTGRCEGPAQAPAGSWRRARLLPSPRLPRAKPRECESGRPRFLPIAGQCRSAGGVSSAAETAPHQKAGQAITAAYARQQPLQAPLIGAARSGFSTASRGRPSGGRPH